MQDVHAPLLGLWGVKIIVVAIFVGLTLGSIVSFSFPIDFAYDWLNSARDIGLVFVKFMRAQARRVNPCLCISSSM